MQLCFDSYLILAVPASPPDNVTVIVNSTTTIIVTWDSVPPIDQNGIITMYEVLYEPLETFGGAIETLSRNVSVTDMSVVLMDLEEFVYYNISVRAYTSVGEGPYSDGVTKLTDNDGNETFLHEAIASMTVMCVIFPTYLPLKLGANFEYWSKFSG